MFCPTCRAEYRKGAVDYWSHHAAMYDNDIDSEKPLPLHLKQW